MSLFNDYVRNTLDFGQDVSYRPSIYGSIHWSWKHNGRTGTLNVMNNLAEAMKLNPNMKIMLAGGYFDLGTPFYAAEFEMHQLPIPPKLQKNISYHFFESGHMVYLNPVSHKKLHDAAAAFIEAKQALNSASYGDAERPRTGPLFRSAKMLPASEQDTFP